jgi:hypothetical protein
METAAVAPEAAPCLTKLVCRQLAIGEGVGQRAIGVIEWMIVTELRQFAGIDDTVIEELSDLLSIGLAFGAPFLTFGSELFPFGLQRVLNGICLGLVDGSSGDQLTEHLVQHRLAVRTLHSGNGFGIRRLGDGGVLSNQRDRKRSRQQDGNRRYRRYQSIHGCSFHATYLSHTTHNATEM